MHPPLLAALQAFNQSVLPAGTRLFHGSRERSPHTDRTAQKLTGTRKWLSQSAEYAVSYAYVDQTDLGARLLWVCELIADVPSLQGSQASLMQSSPWAHAFPWEFPNAFGSYANAIVPGLGPRALLDHQKLALFREVLLTMPAQAIRIVEVIELPEEKHEAEALAKTRFNC